MLLNILSGTGGAQDNSACLGITKVFSMAELCNVVVFHFFAVCQL